MPIAELPDFLPALPEIFIAVIAMALLMLGVFQKTGTEGDQGRRSIFLLSVVTLVLTMLLMSIVTSGPRLAFNGLFVTNSFTVFVKVLVLLASAFSIFMAQGYLKTQGVLRYEYPILILFATLGMMMMISANDLISLYMGLELQSLSLYVLASFSRDDTRSTEAGLKYFVLGALASGMLLYGSSLVYGFTGTTSFDELATLLSAHHDPSMGLVIGIVFILAGLAFKVSAVPFHMWTPDVYEGAPTPVTMFFSVAPKLAAIALFARVMIGPFGDLADTWQQVVVFISIASMVVGAFGGIVQTNIKRLMAYSSIGHVGYMLIGLAVGTELGVQALLVYITIYLFMNLGVFACILIMRRGGVMVENISDLAGLGKSHPMVALGMTIFMFSMAGIPPLAGFVGKLYVFLAAIDGKLYALAIIGALASVVAAFYYLRIVKVMYFDEPADILDRPVGRGLGAVMVGTGLIIALLIIYPEIIISSAGTAAAALFAG